MKRLSIAVLTTLLLALAGCSANSDASSPTPTPSNAPPASNGPNASPSSPASAAAPVSQCLTGRSRLIRFVGVGERGTYGTGEGGDVTVTFNGGSYVLSGAGKDPIKLTLAGQTAGLLVDGTISGNYQLQGDRATFTVGESSGDATLNVGKVKQSVPISDVGKVLAPDGEAGLSCANNALIVTLQDMRLELGKI
ncbi:MAG TPA: hypothetical protein VFT17_05700 [Propionibacteriaceae bacterium]|nr:hypothetical protein [Propionibacteriaceae bacterium]